MVETEFADKIRYKFPPCIEKPSVRVTLSSWQPLL